MATYTIRHSNGAGSTTHETFAKAVRTLEQTYESIALGDWDDHGSDGARRMLAWETEHTAVDDDGSKAVAEIISL